MKQHPSHDPNDLDLMRRVAAGQLPKFDSQTIAGAPCWRLPTICAWLNVSMAELIDYAPRALERRSTADMDRWPAS